MSLFFIADSSEFDLDLLVRCGTKKEALKIWREHWDTAATDVSAAGLRVFLVDPEAQGALGWDKECKRI